MDLFDMVRAAPPPQSIEDTTEPNLEAGGDAHPMEKTSSPLPAQLSPIFNQEDESESDAVPRSSPIFCIAQEEDTTDKNSVNENKPIAKIDEKVSRENSDNNETDDDDQPQMPKTKAEQKMFTDGPSPSEEEPEVQAEADTNTKNAGRIKKCVVRIKKLSQSEIDRLMSFTASKPNKRGRPRKRPIVAQIPSQDDTPLVKKQKTVNSKVHIKGPWLQNGSKQRNAQSCGHTPPPSPRKYKKPINSQNISSELVERYGSRFFNCAVMVKRLKNPERFAPQRTIVRKSKSKLSVSFSEAVEILGSQPRKSSSIKGTPKPHSKLSDSVPTRLQRVDSTGNVVEDIELNMLGSRPARKPGRPPTCNGGKRGTKLKRSPLRVPDLTSLRIDDSQDEMEGLNSDVNNDAGEEYIVPNEMSDFQSLSACRPGTPKPMKKLTVTTTVSDEESTEGPEPKDNEAEVTLIDDDPETEPDPDPATEAEPKAKANASNAEAEAEGDAKGEAEGDAKADEVTETEAKEEQRKSVEKEDEQKQLEANPEAVYIDSESLDSQAEVKLSIDESELEIVKETTPLSTALADDVTTDDILEIQTSIDDVRDLHTPPSRQSLSPAVQQISNRSQRFESPDSESSFKSANEQPAISAAPVKTPSANASTQPTSAPGTNESELPASTTDENIGNSAQDTSFSPIDEISNLDDDELGQLQTLIFN